MRCDPKARAPHVIDMAELAAEELGGPLTDEDWVNAEALCRDRGWDDVAETIHQFRIQEDHPQ